MGLDKNSTKWNQQKYENCSAISIINDKGVTLTHQFFNI